MIAVEPIEAKATERTSTVRFYRPELDVVRFFAFAAIFLHHELPRDVTQQQNGAFLGHLSLRAQALLSGTANAFGFGLALFFTLSAYLIGTLLLREKELYGNVDLRAFYIRRILRIWPLYFFGLAIGCVFAIFIAKKLHDLLLLASFGLMVGNWFSMIWRMSNPMTRLWSISIEEQFYLFCPVTVKYLSRRGLYVFSASLIALSDLTLYILGQLHVVTDSAIWLNSFVQFQMFGAGLLLCLWTTNRRLSIPVWGRLLSLVSGFACWLIACLVFDAKHVGFAKSGSSMVAGYTVGAIGCLLILLAMLDVDRRWLPGWMVWLGRVSFGLYVYHQLAIDSVPVLFVRTHGYVHFLLCFVSALALTVFLAALSYRFLEMPFLRMKERFEIVPSRLA
jgi:peptidoglycan/LPS O-acetylase OafA/YrhL